MKKYFEGLIAVFLMLCFSGIANAVLVTPDDLIPFTGLSYDQDEAKPEESNDTGAPGFGTSSFYSNVTGSTIGGGVDYTALRIYGNYFSPGLTLGDITNISYWTNNTDDSLIDWGVKIYTVDADSGPGWYDTRLNFEFPTGGVEDTWNSYDISTLGVAYTRNGATNVENHTSGQSLSDFSSEQLLFIDITAGYATSSPSVQSYLDGVTIETDSGTYTLDLGAATVPEPATLALIGFGVFGLGLIRRRKLK
jgi:hypothetical protein